MSTDSSGSVGGIPLFSPDLPTEVGTYLFCGSREGRISVRDVVHDTRVEIVRVTRTLMGTLSYIGMDFFYKPKNAVGLWLRIDDLAQAMLQEAQRALLRHIARTEVPRSFQDAQMILDTEGVKSKASILSYLLGNRYFDRDDKGQETATAERVFDVAVADGILVPATKDPYPHEGGWWQLAAPKNA